MPSDKDIHFGADEKADILRSSAGREINRRIDELKKRKEFLEQTEREFSENLRNHENHDALMDICVSAFGPESACYKDLGYGFVSADPLVELNIKNFDILVYNNKSKHAIFVQCKSSLSKPGEVISDMYEAMEGVIKNKNYLEEKIGDSIEREEFVVCVPAERVDKLVRRLEDLEGNSKLKTDKLMLVWYVNAFANQTLQLFTRIRSRDEFQCQHMDADLTRVLARGLPVDKAEVFFKTYPTSHPLHRGSHAVTHIVTTNMAVNAHAAVPLTRFSKSIAEKFFLSAEKIPHYSIDIIGKRLMEHFINEGTHLGLLSVINAEKSVYELNVEGKTLRTILSNYKEQYKKRLISNIVNERAEMSAFKEFFGRQSKLPG